MQTSVKVRGSTLLTKRWQTNKEHFKISSITDWVVISPLELKIHIMAQNDVKAY